jgi:hypothetical protein
MFTDDMRPSLIRQTYRYLIDGQCCRCHIFRYGAAGRATSQAFWAVKVRPVR